MIPPDPAVQSAALHESYSLALVLLAVWSPARAVPFELLQVLLAVEPDAPDVAARHHFAASVLVPVCVAAAFSADGRAKVVRPEITRGLADWLLRERERDRQSQVSHLRIAVGEWATM